ncbi:hybrid sensor histidine kinase/response regulator transcription factor [Hymenobacter setariae]|nr:ATP-binding protein [Hymenobacter setariae]
MRAIAAFYKQRHQLDKALTYSMAAADLNDSLQARKNRYNVSYYEQQAVERSQAGRIASLRHTQAQAEARTRRQHLWLLVALGGLALLGGGAGLLWRLYRQKQRANTLLASQKLQIEEQAARLGALDEAKNQFFANVSHELRTPLTLILGPLDTLLTNPAQQLPAAVQATVALAHRQARRLQQLVNRILDLTKLQAGRLALHPTPTPLGTLLRRVVSQFESLATQRGIALHGPAAVPESLRLLLDADKVEEILTNLLINALNHTPAGGSVEVAVALPAAGEVYSITVRDTGPGIAPAEQARIFERFYQSPQGQAQGGTGLGLALSRELAQLLGGSLTLVSELGQGAAFTLRFPAEVLPEAATAPIVAPGEPAPESALQGVASTLPAGPVGNGPRPRVLVVEDQPDLREYLRGLLAPTYEVLLAEDGQAALGLLAREAPVDLITTDAMMPRLSGTELLTHLRADPAQQSVPVLMLTARADDAHRLAALTVGVDDYLTKPFATAELLARVHALLARHQVRRQFAALPPEPQGEPEEAGSPRPRTEPLLAGPVAATHPAPPARRAEANAAEVLGHWQVQVASHLADERFGPAELAELLCLSERTLYRRLGQLAGLTPAAWLRELRLTQARQLFEAGNFTSVAEVADAVGFGSPKYFATLYTERFGRRPADYRP